MREVKIKRTDFLEMFEKSGVEQAVLLKILSLTYNNEKISIIDDSKSNICTV